MKLNKLMLPVILITPLFINSCDSGSGGDVTSLTIDAYDFVYAYSESCSTSLTISSSIDVEFVDDFKKEYFTFDKQEDIQGKSYEVKKTASKTIVVTLTGAYNGLSLSQNEDKEIKYKISKSAFKNNKVKNDATGKMFMKWDNVVPESISYGPTVFHMNCLFTPADIVTTKVTLKTTIDETSHNISEYCSTPGATGTIKFSRVVSEKNKIYLRIELAGLKDAEQSAYPIIIPNKTGAELFDNLPVN